MSFSDRCFDGDYADNQEHCEQAPSLEDLLQTLDRLHAASELSELFSTHIVNEGYTHLANLTTAPDKPCFVIMNRKEQMDWFAAIHNAYPKLRAQLAAETARADKAERDERIASGALKQSLVKMLDFRGEISAIEFEHSALAAHAADLRAALEGAVKWLPTGCGDPDACKTEDCASLAELWPGICAALANTPAASLEAHDREVKAEALREAANLIRQTTPDPGASEWGIGRHSGRIVSIEQIEDLADRLQAGGSTNT